MPARHVVLAVAVPAIFLLAVFGAAPAAAHLAGDMDGGWSAGLGHPFSGIDHLAAMVAVGIWSTQLERRALWLLPAIFPVFMGLGAGLGVAGVALPGAEDGIAMSVAVLGVLLAVAARPRLAVGAALVGLFGLFHGYAHGAGMPETVQPVLYGLGLLFATAALHLAGIGIGLAARSPTGQRLLPVGAAAIAGVGITLILAL
jgi:urease accessory protein